MRLRIADRILVAIAGLLLLALCAGIVAQMFFDVDLVSLAVRAFSSDAPRVRWGLIGLAAVLLLLGIYCVLVLFRHRRRKDKFILQKNDSGELAISLKALENMVRKCIDQHQEIDIQRLYLENRKDGLLIRLRGSVAGGISIPLTVEALQKQIRQYVTACSGVEIKGVRVQIESSGEETADAPFAIAAPAAKPLLKEPAQESAPVQNAVNSVQEPAVMQDVVPADELMPGQPEPEVPPVAQEPVIPVTDEEDDRPLHQRLFSAEPEACIVPEPPVESEEAAPDRVEAETAPVYDAPVEEMEIPVIPEESEDSGWVEDGSDPEKPEEPEISVIPEDFSESEDPEETVMAEDCSEPEETDDSATAADASEPVEADDFTEDQAPAEETSDTDRPKADPDFLASLSAFDRIVTGKKEDTE